MLTTLTWDAIEIFWFFSVSFCEFCLLKKSAWVNKIFVRTIKDWKQDIVFALSGVIFNQGHKFEITEK